MPNKIRFLRYLLKWASAAPNPWPNPYTAAAVVKEGQIIGQGRHLGVGTPHAEVLAIREAGLAAQGATLFVTLEPCTHFGKTPPCIDTIIQAGISHVVYAAPDPNPLVQALGGAGPILRGNGIAVDAPFCLTEALRYNAPFFKTMGTQKPFITAKIAASLDGKIALRTGESTYITNPTSRTDAHRLRAAHDVIVVGVGTLIADDPLLTIRNIPSITHPAVLIIDPLGKTPATARIFTTRSPEQIVIASHVALSPAVRSKATIISLPAPSQHEISFYADVWKQICDWCWEKGWKRILIEGGERVFSSAFDAKIVDQVVWYTAPLLLGGKDSFLGYGGTGVLTLPNAQKLYDLQIKKLKEDTCFTGFLCDPHDWIKEFL